MGQDFNKVLVGIAGIGAIIGGIVVGGFWGAGLIQLGAMAWHTARNKGTGRQREKWQYSGPSNVGNLPVIYGRAKLGGRLADIRAAGSTNQHLWAVAAICHGGRLSGASGGIEDWREIYLDEVEAVNASGVVQGDFSGKLNVYYHDGEDNQVVDSNLNAAFATAWPATSTGKGVAYLVLKMLYDREVYTSNLPNLTVIVDGCKVYDLRDSTWKFSDNPALCVYDYLRSEVYGLGCAAAEIDEDSFKDAANYCDESVNIPGGSQTRYTLNGIVDTSRPITDNLEQMLTSCRGTLVYQNGQFRLWIPKAETPTTFELNESNIIGDWEFSRAGFGDVVNELEATFCDYEAEYQPNQVFWPRAGESNAYLTNDNGFIAKRRLDLPFTSNYYMAEHIINILLQESRQDTSCAVTVTEAAQELWVGAVVPVTHETPGWSSDNMRVMAMGMLPDGNIRLILKEYEVEVYTLGAQSSKIDNPATDLPDPTSVAFPTSLSTSSVEADAYDTLSGKVPRIKMTWVTSTHTWLDFEDIYYKKNADSDWIWAGKVPAGEEPLFYVGDLDANTSYDVGVQAVNTLGNKSTLVTDTLISYAPDGYEPDYPDPDPPDSVTLTADSVLLEVKGPDGSIVSRRYVSTLIMSIAYTKDVSFLGFRYRVWNGSEDREEAEIFESEGLGGASPYTVRVRRSDKHLLSDTWHCEVEVLSENGRVSGWVADDVTADTLIETLDQEGARRGLGLLPDGEPDPERDPDVARRRRSRDLFSGDGAAGGHRGRAGGGDTPAVSAEDIEIGSDADYRRPLKDVIGVGSDGKPEITDPSGTRMIDLENRGIEGTATIDGDTASDVKDGSARGRTGLESNGDVSRNVPLAKAVANVDGIDTATGRVDEDEETAQGRTIENTVGSQRVSEEAIKDSPGGDLVKQGRSRDLFSGQGSPSGQSGTSGSGDREEVSHQDVILGSGDDLKPLSPGVTEDTITPFGALGEDVGQVVGSVVKRLLRGWQSGTAKSGVSVTFDPTFDNVPLVLLSPNCITYEPREWDSEIGTVEQINTASYDGFGLLIKTGSDTIIYFTRQGTSHVGDKGKIIKQVYTISTDSWGSRSDVFDDASADIDCRNVGGGIIGSYIYLFFGRYNKATSSWVNIGYIKSTDLTGASWGSFVAISTAPWSNMFSPHGHIVAADASGTYYQPFYGNDGSGSRGIKLFQTTDSGASWSVGPTVYSGAELYYEPCVAHIGGGDMICLIRDDRYPTPDGNYVLQSTSDDDGATWSSVAVTNLGASTGKKIPHIIYDSEIDVCIALYHDRGGSGYDKISVTDAATVFADETAWNNPEVIDSGYTMNGYGSIVKTATKAYFYVHSKEISSSDADTWGGEYIMKGWGANYDADKPQYLELMALDLTASGFEVRARLKQKGSQTSQYDEFASGAGRVLDAVGETREANLSPAEAISDKYTVHFKVDLEARNDLDDTYAYIVVAIDSNDGGGWIERATYQYSVFAAGGDSASNAWSHEQKIITVTGLEANDDIRIRIKSEYLAGKTVWDTLEVTCFNKDTNSDAEHGVTYYSATDYYASATPDVDDSVFWEAVEVS